MRGVSFTQVKSNKMNYKAICVSITEGDNASRDVCPWRLHASVSKKFTWILYDKKNIGEHTCSQPSQTFNDSKTTTSFMCNVILPIVRKKLDMTPGYIIHGIEIRYHITISYSKT